MSAEFTSIPTSTRESEGKLPLNYGFFQEGTIVSWIKGYNCWANSNSQRTTGKATAGKEPYSSPWKYTGLRLPLYIRVTTSSPLEKKWCTVSRIPGFCFLFAYLLIWLLSRQRTSQCTFQLTSIIFKRTLLKVQLLNSLPKSLGISWWKWGNSSCFYLVT